MSRPLYPYYERELAYLRQSAREFARQYPATAGRLLLEPGHSADPHVERLLEGVALLAGRVHHKLDDEFPELTDALLSILYPHLLAPIPSAAILQFDTDADRMSAPEGYTLPAGTRLRTQMVNGVRCQYRTTSPVTLWPLELRHVEFLPPPFPREVKVPPRTAAVLRLRFETRAGVKLADLKAEQLRLFLSADPQVVVGLYEVLLNNAQTVTFRNPDAVEESASITRPGSECLLAGGFGADDGLLPYPPHALPGYRLLTEYFAFPPKFWFVDLAGLANARSALGGRRLDVTIALDRTLPLLEQAVGNDTLRLGCVPVVNLFDITAEPIPVTHARSEYTIVPKVSAPLGMEVYSVSTVSLTSPSAGGAVEYQPFFSLRYDQPAQRRAFWYASRRSSVAPDDRGTQVQISLVDSEFRAQAPADGVLIVRAVCSNRDLPDRLRQSGLAPQFELDLAAPVARIRCLTGPTSPMRPYVRRGFWPLISHLSLTHLGLNEDSDATTALKGILSLYDLTDTESGDQRTAAARQAIDGITRVASRPVIRRVGSRAMTAFCRGLEIDLLLDEEKFIGIGTFLFASVLERYFALHATANSFTQLVVRTRHDGEPLRTWAPRTGDQPLL